MLQVRHVAGGHGGGLSGTRAAARIAGWRSARDIFQLRGLYIFCLWVPLANNTLRETGVSEMLGTDYRVPSVWATGVDTLREPKSIGNAGHFGGHARIHACCWRAAPSFAGVIE